MRHLRSGWLAFIVSLLPVSTVLAQEPCSTKDDRFALDITDYISDTVRADSSNIEVVERKNNNKAIKISYPKGSYDPKSMLELKKPVGGINVRVNFEQSYDCLYLDYDLRFANDFDFVKGGKLPGLFGGTGNTGGRIPTGYDGFSSRFLWLAAGAGAVYAYLPTSKVWGTALGANSWSYKRGQWHHVTQKVRLNSVGQSNGILQVWLDHELVYSNHEVTYRYDDGLLIDGILFSSFFGGNKPKFASAQDTFIQVSSITISDHLLGK